MDAERLECLSCVQPVLPPAQEEGSWQGSDETVGDQEGREEQEVSDPQHIQTPQLGKGRYTMCVCDHCMPSWTQYP